MLNSRRLGQFLANRRAARDTDGPVSLARTRHAWRNLGLDLVYHAWGDEDAPVVICLAPPDIPRPKALTALAQLRIDLLAIEQAAWSLASRDARLTVVATRTEIDWALRQGNMIVWAPAKMVFDTPGAPRAGAEGMALTGWLADELDATRIVVHGPVAPMAESRVPVERL